VYADTSATQEQYNNFYENHNIYENGVSVSDKEKYTIIHYFLKDRVHKDKSILEIGFANGELLKMLRASGYKNLYGLDPSQSCVDDLNASGIKAFKGSIGEHNVDMKFDFIILSHVMEHILDIDSSMNSIKNLLTNGGQVYIETPDMEQYKANSVTPFNYFDLEHINHFASHSLITLAEQHGFRVMEFGSKKWSIGDGKFYPACWVMGYLPYIAKSKKCYDSIKSYIRDCVEKTYPEIEALIASQEPVIVWGTGSFAQRLYMQAHLDRCNVLAFVDNNKKKWMSEFGGKKIIPPADINAECKILIASVYGSKDIKEQLKNMGLNNPTIVLTEK